MVHPELQVMALLMDTSVIQIMATVDMHGPQQRRLHLSPETNFKLIGECQATRPVAKIRWTP